MFVTLFYMQLDPQKNELTYVNAGHNPPLHYRAREKDLVELKATGIMLGFTELVVHKQRAVLVEPNDFVVIYTDGVTEAMNEQNEQFGEERLQTLLLAQRDQTPHDMLQSLRDSLVAFVGNRNQSDDITVVIAKRTSA
jgi:sigma-B regulation protein RsbU (phosphoserine phosphatase)